MSAEWKSRAYPEKKKRSCLPGRFSCHYPALPYIAWLRMHIKAPFNSLFFRCELCAVVRDKITTKNSTQGRGGAEDAEKEIKISHLSALRSAWISKYANPSVFQT